MPSGTTGTSQETLCWSRKRWWRWLWYSAMLADKCRPVIEAEMIIKKRKSETQEAIKSALLSQANLAFTIFPLATAWTTVQRCAYESRCLVWHRPHFHYFVSVNKCLVRRLCCCYQGGWTTENDFNRKPVFWATVIKQWKIQNGKENAISHIKTMFKRCQK